MDEIKNAGAVITILAGVFGVLVALLLYIWNLTQKANDNKHAEKDKRHESQEKMIAGLLESEKRQDAMFERLTTIVEFLREELKELKTAK